MKNGRPTLAELDALQPGDVIIYGRRRIARTVLSLIHAKTGKLRRCTATSPLGPSHRPTSIQRSRLHEDVHTILKRETP